MIQYLLGRSENAAMHNSGAVEYLMPAMTPGDISWSPHGQPPQNSGPTGWIDQSGMKGGGSEKRIPSSRSRNV